MSRIPSFKNLDVWQKAMKLVRRIYETTRSYPVDERFGLASETRKSVRSIPAKVGRMLRGLEQALAIA